MSALITPPDDLAEVSQWVLWQVEERDGKATKVPFSTNGTRAKSNDPLTWASYEDVRAAYQSGAYAGIGFVFSDDDPFVGIDLDDCLNDAGCLEAWAVPIVDRFHDTYMEVSPSGNGIKIFARGSIDRAAKFSYQSGAIEVYAKGRYFTVTGNVWNDAPMQVEEAQAAIDWIRSLKPASSPSQVKEGGRNNELTRLAGRVRRNGASVGEVNDVLQVSNRALCVPPLAPAEVASISNSSGRWEPLGASFGPHNLLTQGENDHGNAERIKLVAGDDLCFCHAERSWYVWDGRRYAKDASGQAIRIAKDVVIEFLRQAVHVNDEAVLKFAKRSLDHSRIMSALSSLQSELPVSIADFDSQKHLLNFHNGTVDLQTGELRPHNRADRITKLIQHDYQPGAPCKNFRAMLEKTLPQPRLADFVQRAIGYSLTGEVSEKVVFICHGITGNNGKTTLMDAIRQVAPEYSTKIHIDTLMERAGGESNNTQADLMDLMGARFANTSETESGKRLSEGKLKRITQGMGTIKGVRKYENPIEFAETHKLWIDANHLPVIKGTDDAIWRRFRAIPFNVTLLPHEIDRSFPTKLLAEAEGILSWIVAGARLWYSEGLGKSKVVDSTVAEWREEMDIVKPFLDEMCEFAPGNKSAWISKTKLWGEYLAWCDRLADSRRVDKQAFYSYVTSKGAIDGQDPEGKTRAFKYIRFSNGRQRPANSSEGYPATEVM